MTLNEDFDIQDEIWKRDMDLTNVNGLDIQYQLMDWIFRCL